MMGDGRTLFVGSLAWGATEDDLRSAFEEIGSVESVRIVNDRDTGRSRGFGFVTFVEKSDADTAITACAGKEVAGRAITCAYANSR